MKSVLMIAFHYPPAGASSGMQRSLKFSQYLGELGWRPIVLTVQPRAHSVVREDQLKDIADDVIVRRAFALDAARHLRLWGWYPRLAASPDRWVSWWPGAVLIGRRLLKEYRPRLIWSTYPIATAHLIADALRKMSKIPWVADFRDPMVEGDYPPDPSQRRAYLALESRTMRSCARAVFTTEGARRLYAGRFPERASDELRVIPNGFDEESFGDAERLESVARPRVRERPLTLLHSGVLYPNERDPRDFFAALARLRSAGSVHSDTLRVVFRAPGFLEHHQKLIRQLEVQDVVSLEPGLPYREALREMIDADGLLLLQASNCNNQVPAKLYEYIRARRPILALTDAAGDTAAVLRKAGVGSIAPLNDAPSIARALIAFIDEIRSGKASIASGDAIDSYSRKAGTIALAKLFDELTFTRPAPAPTPAPRAREE